MSKVDEVFALICDMNQVELKRLCDLAEAEGLTLGVFAQAVTFAPSAQVVRPEPRYTVHLESYDQADRALVVELLMKIKPGLTRWEADDLIRWPPVAVLSGATAGEALEAEVALQRAGAKVGRSQDNGRWSS